MFRAVDFPVFRQLDQMDCGPSCIKMVTDFFGGNYDIEYLRKICYLQKDGSSFAGLSNALKKLEIETVGVRINFLELITEVPLPTIAHWEGNHFVVIYKVSRKHIFISDPAYGKLKYSHKDFLSKWADPNKNQGVLLLLEPNQHFEFPENEPQDKVEDNGKYLIEYLKPFKAYIRQLILGLIIAIVIQLMLPFLTQSLVDYGINYEDFSFINLILICQFSLFLIRSLTEIIRDWLLLYLSISVNIQMISDFLGKLLTLPIAYFESKNTGDFLQRIYDHQRIEEFITGRGLNIPFDIFSIMIFGIILFYFHPEIALVFFTGTLLFLGWSFLFIKRREILDNQIFDHNRKDQSLFLQMILAVSEIKLNNSETRRKTEWKINQNNLFAIKSKILRVEQAQIKGGFFLNELTNILIIYLSARAVISGQISLGAMLAIQFVIGSLSLPVSNIINFFTDYQSAKLSFNRLSEIHKKTPEETSSRGDYIEPEGSVSFNNISFGYGDPSLPPLFKNLSVIIPCGKTTAIVGSSGSGKTTLLKILLKFYSPWEGSIRVGNNDLKFIDSAIWRSKCGVVMQDGCFFNDTLERNITESQPDVPIDKILLRKAVEMVNLNELIEQLPLGFKTHIGENGQLLSGGERQRLLLARAIYKNPDYLFLDEATSSLDTQNEKIISDHLKMFYKKRTVVVIAHRLSTVMDADQILVMEKGSIVERGNHDELIAKKGVYHNLIKHQLKI
ncbi:peptidase domain-containing ABC transporter [Salegentibacter maritimus]|uniref:peptidase domain-containing ABC transporter n=1 Tax=Salegentibacter maritimus TaxID=2794347 RepID=UPI0018E40C8C|nr:peptidase domain-containing ABC transporter [Salegentibacter maritimus]MBI6116018.1 peptidase domain-containing ABC transporter [Salegentibacter maritimus]